jgi:hypothetical protein
MSSQLSLSETNVGYMVVQAAKWHGQGQTDNLDSRGSAAAALAAKAQPCP